jgi:hypothetical protein
LRLIVSLFSLALGLLAWAALCVASVQAQPGSDPSNPGKAPYAAPVSIQVLDGDWGNAVPDDIRAVLQSVSAALMQNFPGRRLPGIVVRNTGGNPYVAYARGPGGEYQVYLNVQDRRWGQYVYQFAHELTHILTNFQHREKSVIATHSQWFEETLCEVASLWTLKHLAASWAVSAPYPQWREYAPVLLNFANGFLKQEHRALPPGHTPAQWMRLHEDTLRDKPYLRSQNELVANLLLPMFEENPATWEAVMYLNLEDKGSNFSAYLALWYANAPDDYKDIIRHVMALLGARP